MANHKESEFNRKYVPTREEPYTFKPFILSAGGHCNKTVCEELSLATKQVSDKKRHQMAFPKKNYWTSIIDFAALCS